MNKGISRLTGIALRYNSTDENCRFRLTYEALNRV